MLFCPSALTVARGGALQMSAELTSRPRLPPFKVIVKRVDRSVGEVVEKGADALFSGTDLALENDPDRAASKRSDEIGQAMHRGAQVDVAAKRLIEQRGIGDRLAVDRSGRAAFGLELRAGADSLM